MMNNNGKTKNHILSVTPTYGFNSEIKRFYVN